MKIYVLTEEQRDALLKELELEKHKRSQFFLTPAEQSLEPRVREEVYRSFHYIVCRALDA